MKRIDNDTDMPLAGKIAGGIAFIVSVVFIGVVLAYGGTASAVQEHYQTVSNDDTETRLLVAYLGRVHNDAGDQFTLDTWEYIVTYDGAALTCGERAPWMPPSVRYLNAYLNAGGTISEDGSCNQTVAP